jgi:hypothetical protein
MSELRSIKFFSKKIIMRPQDKGFGKTEVWSPNYSTVAVLPVQFIIYDGVRYFIQNVTEKTEK